MTKLQKINRFLNSLKKEELKYYLRAILNDTLTAHDVMEDVDYE